MARVGPSNDPDRYRLVERISSGGEGQLWKAIIDVDGAEVAVAVKIIHPSKSLELDEWRTRWQRQAELLRSLDHPGLVKVREVFDGPEAHELGAADMASNTLYLVMNWVDGPTLEEWVSRSPNRDVLDSARVLGQLASAVDYLHAGAVTGNPVLHRDIKPANVIVGASGAVLVDFGFSRVLGGQQLSFVGTPAYIAPEILDGQEFSPASDRYSLGATGYFALTGQAPTPNDTQHMATALTAVAGAKGRDDIANHVLSMMDRAPAGRPVSSVAWAQQLAAASISDAPMTQFGATAAAAPAGTAGGAVVAPVPPADNDTKRRPVILAVIGAIATLAVLIAGLVVLSGRGDDDARASAPSSTQGPETTTDTTVTEASDPEVAAPASTVAEPTTTTTTSTTSTTVALVELPDLVGQTPESAQASLVALGVESVVVEEEGPGPYGEVVATEPAEGTTLDPGAVVQLLVRRQPATMPDVVGSSRSEATKLLQSYGITATYTEVLADEPLDNTVTAQVPAAGEPFATDAALTVARRPAIVYFEDFRRVDGGGCYEVRLEPAQINGQIYTRSAVYRVQGTRTCWQEYDLARGFERMVTLIGPLDTVQAGSLYKYEFFVDGEKRLDHTLGLGETLDVDLDVSNGLRLRLQVTKVSGDGGNEDVGFAELRFLGFPDRVPVTESD